MSLLSFFLSPEISFLTRHFRCELDTKEQLSETCVISISGCTTRVSSPGPREVLQGFMVVLSPPTVTVEVCVFQVWGTTRREELSSRDDSRTALGERTEVLSQLSFLKIHPSSSLN